jgi:hypothetical protein
MIHRRNLFLGLLAAPAVVRASSLMPIYAPPLVLYGDGVHDDTEALQAYLDGKPVRFTSKYVAHGDPPALGSYLMNGEIVTLKDQLAVPWNGINRGKFFITGSLVFGRNTNIGRSLHNCEFFLHQTFKGQPGDMRFGWGDT